MYEVDPMDKPKRHHIVPKSYLANFTNENGQLHVTPKARDSGPFVAAPANVAVRRHYHSTRDEKGVIDVKVENVEPTWDCSRGILSPVRLPVSPLRQ